MSKLVKNIYLKDCPVCGQAHEVEEREADAEAIIKGEKVIYKGKYYYCQNADPEESEFETARMANKNLLAARDAYRKKHQLLTSKEIVALRKQYGLSQVELAKLLGWGEATISRYESKSIQDESHNALLQLLRKDPLSVLHLLDRNGKDFSETKKDKIEEAVKKNLNSYGREHLARRTFASDYISYLSPSDSNGQTRLNIDKLEAVISYFAQKVYSLHKVKLMKMLWYADSLSFKENGHAITGLVYQHEKMGALPVGYRYLADLSNVNAQEELSSSGYEMTHFYPSDNVDYSVLSSQDKKILDVIIEKFKSFNAQKITDYMHQELAYKETKDKEIIPFSLAKQIRKF